LEGGDVHLAIAVMLATIGWRGEMLVLPLQAWNVESAAVLCCRLSCTNNCTHAHTHAHTHNTRIEAHTHVHTHRHAHTHTHTHTHKHKHTQAPVTAAIGGPNSKRGFPPEHSVDEYINSRVGSASSRVSTPVGRAGLGAKSTMQAPPLNPSTSQR